VSNSIFADHRNSQFEARRVTIQFVNRLIGGCPKDAKLVQGWLGKNMGLEGEDLRIRMVLHLIEMGVDVPEDATVDELMEATDKLAGEIKTQGFKVNEDGRPYIESRQIKAGIKESVSILFPGGKAAGTYKWGKTGKGPAAYAAERAFVQPEQIIVADEVDGTDLFLGHVSGPRGKMSTIGYAEYVERPTISFVLLTARDSDDLDKAWPDIWTHMELNGIGARRSQGFGQFEVIEFAKQDTTDIESILGNTATLA